MNTHKRIIKWHEPIMWTGDLMDDCTASWAGLMLRAELMNEEYWWWSISDTQRDNVTIDDSTQYKESFIGGDNARQKAEQIAKQYITDITENVSAKFVVVETYKITGRGLVFAGRITEGSINTGDILEFVIPGGLLTHRRIIGVESVLKRLDLPTNVGLLIKCEDDGEIDNVREINPSNQIAFVYQSHIIKYNVMK